MGITSFGIKKSAEPLPSKPRPTSVNLLTWSYEGPKVSLITRRVNGYQKSKYKFTFLPTSTSPWQMRTNITDPGFSLIAVGTNKCRNEVQAMAVPNILKY